MMFASPGMHVSLWVLRSVSTVLCSQSMFVIVLILEWNDSSIQCKIIPLPNLLLVTNHKLSSYFMFLTATKHSIHSLSLKDWENDSFSLCNLIIRKRDISGSKSMKNGKRGSNMPIYNEIKKEIESYHWCNFFLLLTLLFVEIKLVESIKSNGLRNRERMATSYLHHLSPSLHFIVNCFASRERTK